MRSINDCRLYGILDLGYVTAEAAPRTLQEMLLGGVDIVQLRAKMQSPAEVAMLAGKLAPIASAAGVPFIINDHPQIVREAGAAGAHVGQDDLDIGTARRMAGPGRLVGKSTHTLAQAVMAADSPDTPDYIGFGPLFATATKPDYQAIGMADIRRVHELVPIPIFCIGGIKLENLDAVLTAGARRVVIVSGILKAADIAGYCREVKARL